MSGTRVTIVFGAWWGWGAARARARFSGLCDCGLIILIPRCRPGRGRRGAHDPPLGLAGAGPACSLRGTSAEALVRFVGHGVQGRARAVASSFSKRTRLILELHRNVALFGCAALRFAVKMVKMVEQAGC